MMMEKPRQQYRQEEPANLNYPAPPVQLEAKQEQKPVSQQSPPIFESKMLQPLNEAQRQMQQIPIVEENFERMPEDCFMSATFQVLSEKKRLKNRFELLDSILSPLNAPLVEAQAIE